jgi:hypothetical protein
MVVMGATVVFLDKGAKVTECGANLGSFLSQFEEELNMILGGGSHFLLFLSFTYISTYGK